jgi:ribonuclease HI
VLCPRPRRLPRRAAREVLKRVTINVDGGSRGNPGPAAIAAVASDGDGEILAERSETIGDATNNVAEYRALLLGIRLAKELEAEGVELIGDSQLIVRQVQGKYKVKNEDLKPLHTKVRDELRDFEKWSIHDVRRERNEEADRLVNEALDAG